MDPKQLQNQLDQYTWYHAIPVAHGVATKPTTPRFQGMWDFNLACLEAVDFSGKTVLDVGCRDGLFSFEAEKRGAREILAIDNDLSRGARDVLVPYFQSKVKFEELSLYDLTPDTHGCFDIVLCLGVLYHLRYPFWGLKRITDCLRDGGVLVLESGMLAEPALQGRDMLHCPVDQSPYEPTSCTFFNARGLETTLQTLNCESVRATPLPARKKGRLRPLIQRCKRHVRRRLSNDPKPYETNRQFFVFRKNRSLRDTHSTHPAKRHLLRSDMETYWNGLHQRHSHPARPLSQT